jgi:hypothetical protein
MESYLFIAISTRENLDLCKKYSLAGFPNTINGAWTYSEINVGDYITFLYGARAHNLYKVIEKEAISNAENLPPWKQLHFRDSGKIVYFPFRLYLETIRELEEPLARPEFYYIAENLLQRGGYWKTHFQADQTTLSNVSQMGAVFKGNTEKLLLPPHENFKPKFIRAKKGNPPEIYQFKELILQSLICQHLSKPHVLEQFFETLKLSDLKEIEFEVLGEKALAEGHIDLLIKEARPRGKMKQIILEIKSGKAGSDDAEQLTKYIKDIGEECIAGVLIASKFSKDIKEDKNLRFVEYTIDTDLKEPQSFDDMLRAIKLSPTKLISTSQTLLKSS